MKGPQGQQTGVPFKEGLCVCVCTGTSVYISWKHETSSTVHELSITSSRYWNLIKHKCIVLCFYCCWTSSKLPQCGGSRDNVQLRDNRVVYGWKCKWLMVLCAHPTFSLNSGFIVHVRWQEESSANCSGLGKFKDAIKELAEELIGDQPLHQAVVTDILTCNTSVSNYSVVCMSVHLCSPLTWPNSLKPSRHNYKLELESARESLHSEIISRGSNNNQSMHINASWTSTTSQQV